MRPKVFVVNKSAHDFSAAERYGDLVFLSEGRINRYHTNDMARRFAPILRDSNPGDFLLCTSLTQMNIVAALILGHLHGGRVNLLIHHRERGYVDRTIHIERLLEE